MNVEQEIARLSTAPGIAALAAHAKLRSIHKAGRNEDGQLAIGLHSSRAAARRARGIARTVRTCATLTAASTAGLARLADLVRNECVAAPTGLGRRESDGRLRVLAAQSSAVGAWRSFPLVRFGDARRRGDERQALERVQEMIERVA